MERELATDLPCVQTWLDALVGYCLSQVSRALHTLCIKWVRGENPGQIKRYLQKVQMS